MSTLVSICIPTYEAPKDLERCLDSIFAQVGVKYEVVVSDDSKTEAIQHLIDTKYSKEKITYHRNSPSKGSPGNWNMARSLAKGEIVHLLHQDDFYIDSLSLRDLVKDLGTGNILFTPCVWYSLQTAVRYLRGISDEKLKDIREKNVGELFECNYLSVPSTMIFRNTLISTYDESFIYMVDVDFYLNSIFETESEKIKKCHRPTVGITIDSPTQVTNSIVNNNLKKDEWNRFADKWRDKLSQRKVDVSARLTAALVREGIL